MAKKTYTQEEVQKYALDNRISYREAKNCLFSGECAKNCEKGADSMDSDIKEILEDAKDGRVKKSTRAKIEKYLKDDKE